MGERRAGRGPKPRTDEQILEQTEDVETLRAIAHGRLRVEASNRMDLRRMAREDLLLAGFGTGTIPTLLPRGLRILAAANGEVAAPLE